MPLLRKFGVREFSTVEDVQGFVDDCGVLIEVGAVTVTPSGTFLLTGDDANDAGNAGSIASILATFTFLGPGRGYHRES